MPTYLYSCDVCGEFEEYHSITLKLTHCPKCKEAALKKFLEYQLPRDAFIRDFCTTHNINLIIIDGRKYTNSKLKDYLINEIIPKLIKHKKEV